jgi:hypothetical protein
MTDTQYTTQQLSHLFSLRGDLSEVAGKLQHIFSRGSFREESLYRAFIDYQAAHATRCLYEYIPALNTLPEEVREMVTRGLSISDLVEDCKMVIERKGAKPKKAKSIKLAFSGGISKATLNELYPSTRPSKKSK